MTPLVNVANVAAQRKQKLLHGLMERAAQVDRAPLLTIEGRLKRVVGLTLEAVGCQAQIGSRCRVADHDGASVEAEVVGFAGERTFLMPIGELAGIAPNARVTPLRRAAEMTIGPDWLGRVLDGEGEPLDSKPKPKGESRVKLAGRQINPFAREGIKQPLDVGVRAINALLTVGRGQRLGLFAGTGVGKSTLLGMMTRYTAADVIVVGLIGERGREVRDFVEGALGAEGLARACVIATPADRSPLQRLHGAWLATAVAEHFRDQGLNVLLLMDSLTRFAQAQREIGLAVGEPPTTRGYPPSVFAKLPALV
ncbi:MAG: flagellum-specific ATP synthase FliI, partial [Stagnimonas sp.]|nr:flagellum-specific ATP synthase FliI [Stagnimonas sp.]